MARRRHQASTRRSLPTILLSVLLVAAVGAGLFAFLKGRSGAVGAEESEADRPAAAPELSFDLARATAATSDAPPGRRRVTSAAGEVRSVLERLYTIAFVDPAEWDEGRFPSLPSVFEGPAARQVTEDLEDLSLGSAAARVERVSPRRALLDVSLLFGEGRAPVSAIAEARFRALGTTHDGQRLRIVHEGRYLLEPGRDGWRIVGYRVSGELEAITAQGGVATG